MSWFTPVTVDTIVADFDKVKTKLETHAANLLEKKNQHLVASSNHAAAASAAGAEASRAASVATKINGLLS